MKIILLSLILVCLCSCATTKVFNTDQQKWKVSCSMVDGSSFTGAMNDVKVSGNSVCGYSTDFEKYMCFTPSCVLIKKGN